MVHGCSVSISRGGALCILNAFGWGHTLHKSIWIFIHLLCHWLCSGNLLDFSLCFDNGLLIWMFSFFFLVFLLFTHTFKGLHANTHAHTHNYQTISPHPAACRRPNRAPGKRAHGSFLRAATKHCLRKCFSFWSISPRQTPPRNRKKRKFEAVYIYVYSQNAAIICISLFIIIAR